MTDIASKAARAFIRREKMAMRNNTCCDGNIVFLHGSCIAWWDDNGVPWMTLAGWPTPTTRDRLNAIGWALKSEGFGEHQFYQSKHVQYYNGREIDHYEKIPCVGPLTALAIAAEKRLATLAAQQFSA